MFICLIQRSSWFIGKNDRGRLNYRPGNRHPLGLTTRHETDWGVQKASHPHTLKSFSGGDLRRGAGSYMPKNNIL